ncbi:hypothetical protein A2U01_0093809, partial [Trifolium medium]|nr:hypothetical protein [Trifolium medium]
GLLDVNRSVHSPLFIPWLVLADVLDARASGSSVRLD